MIGPKQAERVGLTNFAQFYGQKANYNLCLYSDSGRMTGPKLVAMTSPQASFRMHAFGKFALFYGQSDHTSRIKCILYLCSDSGRMTGPKLVAMTSSPARFRMLTELVRIRDILRPCKKTKDVYRNTLYQFTKKKSIPVEKYRKLRRIFD